MTFLAAAGGRDTRLSVDGWSVDTVAGRPGLTRVTRSGRDLHVRVGDRVDGVGALGTVGALGSRHRHSMLAADLSPDGTVRLVASFCPPALVVSRRGTTLLPPDGGATGHCLLHPDELLVMCSAATLDADPTGLVALLQSGPDLTGLGDTERLVRGLVQGSPRGAAAVIRRLPAPAEVVLRTG